MESIPRMDSSISRLKALKGMVPSILELSDGCKLCSRFDPEMCACGGTKVEPELIEIEPKWSKRINIIILILAMISFGLFNLNSSDIPEGMFEDPKTGKPMLLGRI